VVSPLVEIDFGLDNKICQFSIIVNNWCGAEKNKSVNQKKEKIMSEHLRDNEPFGLGLALLENKNALRRFASLSIPKQQEFIENAHSLATPEEFRLYVSNIGRVDEND